MRTGSNHSATAVHSIAWRCTGPVATSRSEHTAIQYRQPIDSSCQPNRTTSHGRNANGKSTSAANGGYVNGSGN